MSLSIITDISLDVAVKPVKSTTICAKQGDTASRIIRVTITNAGMPVQFGNDIGQIPSNAEFHMYFKTYEEESYDATGTLSGDKILFTIPDEALSLPYVVTCDVSIQDDTSRLTTCSFYIDVEATNVAIGG